MDFLDPKKKRNRKIRLAIGHALTAVVVIIATYILVFQAYGYKVDPKTGEIIQNGLVYVDSAPDGAKIRVNGEELKSNTNTRQSLPEGRYHIEISKSGYHSWSRDFNLDGAQVLRYTYPMLVAQNLTPAELGTFDSVAFSTQSPDRRWILLGHKNNLNTMTLYDLERRSNDLPAATTLTLPVGLLSAAPGDHALKLTEWSTDNRHVLLQHNWPAGQEFVVVDREQPARSYNVNKVFNRVPAKVTLFDKGFEKLFLYNGETKVLSIGDVNARTVQDYAARVISYKPHGDDTVMMSVASETDPNLASVVIRQKDKTYKIREIPANDNIPLDIARFDGSWYAAIGVQSEQKSYIYKNPMDLSSRGDITSVRAVVLKTAGPIEQISFSNNARFIMASSGSNFSVYDAELERRFTYITAQPLDTAALRPYWMDGHRIISSSGGKVVIFDYDGINVRTLVAADPAMPAMFDRDFTELYTLGGSGTAGKIGLFLTELRLPGDR